MSAMLVAGAGPVGTALARRFARERYAVALAGRDPERLQRAADEAGGKPFPTDLSREGEVVALFDAVESELGPLDVVAFVAATRKETPLTEVSAEEFEHLWRRNTYAGFLVAREAARRMLSRGHGSLLFTGASPGFRGRARLSAYSAAKGGLRFLAESIAGELGPRGIHVATVMIHGAVDNHLMGAEPARGEKEKAGPDSAVHPDAIAETFWQIHSQPRNAWTHEVDLRPWAEPF